MFKGRVEVGWDFYMQVTSACVLRPFTCLLSWLRWQVFCAQCAGYLTGQILINWTTLGRMQENALYTWVGYVPRTFIKSVSHIQIYAPNRHSMLLTVRCPVILQVWIHILFIIHYRLRTHLLTHDTDEINFYFSGGGIYFWWQAGVATYIQEKKNLNPKLKVNYLGSSAGALSAALLYSNVSMSKAAEYAIYQAEREKLFTNPSGLAFVWGKIVREWLDVLIDEKAIENNRNTGSWSSFFTPSH